MKKIGSSREASNHAEQHALQTMKRCVGECKVVPETVQNAVAAAVKAEPPGEGGNVRLLRVTERVALTMAREGWRFCQCFRHEETVAHKDIYTVVYTAGANHLADNMLAHARKPSDQGGGAVEEMVLSIPWWVSFKEENLRLFEASQGTDPAG